MGETGSCCIVVLGLISIVALATSITSIVLVIQHKSGDAALSSEYHEIEQKMRNLQGSVDQLQNELGESKRKVEQGHQDLKRSLEETKAKHVREITALGTSADEMHKNFTQKFLENNVTLAVWRDEIRRNFTITQDACNKLNSDTLGKLDEVKQTVVNTEAGLNALDGKLTSISTSVDIVYEVKRELGDGTLTTIKENFDDLKSRLESLENVNSWQWALIIMEFVVIVLLCCLFLRKNKALSKSLGLDAKKSHLV